MAVKTESESVLFYCVFVPLTYTMFKNTFSAQTAWTQPVCAENAVKHQTAYYSDMRGLCAAGVGA